MSDASTQFFTGPLQFSSPTQNGGHGHSNGLITSVGAGTTTVTVTASGLAPVSVTATVASRALTSIIVSPASIIMIGAGQTQSLSNQRPVLRRLAEGADHWRDIRVI